MFLLDQTFIRDNVDYSFGDDSGIGILGGYMKLANSSNKEFITKYQECVSIGKPYMTLFIDNIRLYRRDCIKYTACEQMYENWKIMKADKLKRLASEDLLELTRTLPDMRFVIFTGFEDTSIDEAIFDIIPTNVIAIYASNALVFGGKVYPLPYGVQRKLSLNDNRHDIIKELLNIQTKPNKLMYVNFSPGNHQVRLTLGEYYKDKSWVTYTEPGRNSLALYRSYMLAIKNHKFMLCPSGNADGCDCHRDWETIYMRRVPIVEDTVYHRAIFEPLGIPVLYIDDLRNVTEQLLIDNDHLYQQMQNYDMNNLDVEVIYNKIINSINI